MNKASGGDGILVELFQILKDDSMKVLHSIYVSKFRKLSSGHRTGKGQFSFQPQRKAMPKNVHAAAKLLQSCLTLCNPIDSSPPGSPVPGILQARTLEWVAISFSNAWK